MQQKVYYKVNGLNFNKFLSLIKKQNIQTFNFKRLEYNQFIIGVKKQDEKVFFDICKKLNYAVTLQNQTFFLKFLNNVKQNLALMMSVIFLLLGLLVSSNVVFKIEICGLENVKREEVISILNNNGYGPYKLKSNYNLKNLEVVLKQNINNISFASGIIRGNTLLINVNEKIDNFYLTQPFSPIVSPYNCIIKNINLKSGTPTVKCGDLVKEGDILVFPYINYKDGSKLKTEANAEIEAYVELCTTKVYTENHTETSPSGKISKQNSYSLLGLNLGTSGSDNPYKNYQTQTKSYYPFKNFFVPFLKTETYYYELVEKQVYIPFNEVSQNIIEQNQKLLYNKLQGNIIENESFETTITTLNNAYYVTTYLKADIIF